MKERRGINLLEKLSRWARLLTEFRFTENEPESGKWLSFAHVFGPKQAPKMRCSKTIA
jgi:hypothetical protein